MICISNLQNFHNFFTYIFCIFFLHRVNHNIQLPESICDHMYRMAIASILLNYNSDPSNSPPALNISRCLLLSLVHDIGESLTGDIVPMDPMGKTEKQRREKLAMEQIRDTLLPNPAGEEIYQAWEEYEQQQTAEAKVVKDLDRLEMILQAYEYESKQLINLSTFYESVRGKIRHPIIQKWAEEIEQRRLNLSIDNELSFQKKVKQVFENYKLPLITLGTLFTVTFTYYIKSHKS